MRPSGLYTGYCHLGRRDACHCRSRQSACDTRARAEAVVAAGTIERIAASLTDQHFVIAVASQDVVALANDDIFYGGDRTDSGLAAERSTARQGNGRGRRDSLPAPSVKRMWRQEAPLARLR